MTRRQEGGPALQIKRAHRGGHVIRGPFSPRDPQSNSRANYDRPGRRALAPCLTGHRDGLNQVHIVFNQNVEPGGFSIIKYIGLRLHKREALCCWGAKPVGSRGGSGETQRTGHTFVVLPKRWVVEWSFAWLENCRRLWKNCERKLNTSLQMVVLAFATLILKRL